MPTLFAFRYLLCNYTQARIPDSPHLASVVLKETYDAPPRIGAVIAFVYQLAVVVAPLATTIIDKATSWSSGRLYARRWERFDNAETNMSLIMFVSTPKPVVRISRTSSFPYTVPEGGGHCVL